MKVAGSNPAIGTSILITNSVIKGNAMPPRNILGTYAELEKYILRIRFVYFFCIGVIQYGQGRNFRANGCCAAL